MEERREIEPHSPLSLSLSSGCFHGDKQLPRAGGDNCEVYATNLRELPLLYQRIEGSIFPSL